MNVQKDIVIYYRQKAKPAIRRLYPNGNQVCGQDDFASFHRTNSTLDHVTTDLFQVAMEVDRHVF